MKRIFKSALSFFLVAAMVLGAAPLSGFVRLELPKIGGIDLPEFSGFEKIKTAVSDFIDGFSFKAEATSYSGTCGDNLTWTLDTDTGELVISGTGDMTDWDSSNSTPWYSNKDLISYVIINNGVTSIGKHAFASPISPYSVTIPDTVTQIGDAAFYYSCSCVYLDENSQLKIIGENAFVNCWFPENILEIPDSVTDIGRGAFVDCFEIVDIIIPKSVVHIGQQAFLNTEYYFNENNWEDGALYVDDCLIEVSSDVLNSYDIKSGTRIIADSAFYNSDFSLKSVSIPDSVNIIGKAAFANSWITTISFGENSQLKVIEDEAFLCCSDVTKIDFGENSQLTTIGNSAFQDCQLLTDITIPNSVISIGDYAFYCSLSSSLSNVVFEENSQLVSIGDYAFCGTDITNIAIPDNVTTIGNCAFASSYNLTNVSFGDNCSLESIGANAFENTALTSVTIPSSVTHMGDYAFAYCESLTTATIQSTVIGNCAFYDCDSLNSVNISNNVTCIGNSAFKYCYALTSVNVGNGVISIGEEAFYYCEALEMVKFEEGSQLLNIGDKAFYDCDSLESITIPDSVTKIEDDVFGLCPNLLNVYFGVDSNLTSIGERAFSDSCLIKGIVIPQNVNYIGSHAFLFGYLKNAFYSGTQEDWNNITIESGNYSLSDETLRYECIPVTDIEISDTNKTISIIANESKTLLFSTNPESAKNKGPKWSSSNSEVAIVDSTGTVTGVGGGTAIITVEALTLDGEIVSDTCTVTVVKKLREISAPKIESSTGVSCILSAVTPSEGDGTVEYGWSLQDDSSTVTNWQTGLSFDGLSEGPTYYFFARVTGSSAYADAYSIALNRNFSNVPIDGSISLNKNGAATESAVYGETLTADINIEGEYTFSWYRGSEIISGANGTSYTLGVEDINSSISVAAKGDESKGYTSTVTSNFVFVTKASVETPSAPELYEATANSITVVAESGQQYRLSYGSWITPEGETHTYKGLYEGEMYEVSSYIPESESHFASDTSPTLTVITALTYSLDGGYLDKQGVKYNLDSSAKTAAVTSSTSSVIQSEIIIPQYVWKDGVQYKVTTVSASAFSSCTKIETVTLSDTVTTIGTKAFYGCSNLSAAYFDGAVPSSFGGNVFDSAASGFLIYYYPTQSGWTDSIVSGKYNGYNAVPRNAIEEIQRGSSNKYVYIVYVTDASGNVLPGATVDFNRTSETTDANGYAFFEKPAVSTVPMTVSLRGYNSYSEENYPISENISFGCVQLTDDPAIITSAICNGKDVITGKTQINRGLILKKAKITVKGYSQFDITKFEIVQEGKVIATSTDGKFEISNTSFVEDAQTIAVMYTSGGEVAQEVLNITVVNLWLDNIPSISIGEENAITIPGTIIPIGDLTLKLNVDDLPIQYEINNEKITVAVNLGIDDLSIEDKDMLNEGVEEELGKFAEVDCKGSVETSICGYYIANITEDGIKGEESKLCFVLKLGLKAGRTYQVWVIPLRLDVSISAEGKLEFHASFDTDTRKWKLQNMDLDLEAALALYAGIGTRHVSAGLFGSAKMSFLFQILPKAYTKTIDLSGKFGLYAKAFKFRVERVLFQGELNVYKRKEKEEATVASVAYQTFNLISAVYNEENYELVDRDYLENRSEWLSGEETQEVSTFSLRAITSESVSSNNNTLQESVFSNIEPKIVTCGETTMMIYTDDNGGDDEYNNMELVYSIYDEASDTWSVPVRVGGVDFNEGISDIYTDGKDIYIAYIQTNRMFTAEDKMSDYAAASEIAVTKFDFENGTFEEPVIITDNDTADMMPEFAVVDSVPHVVWINNKDNDSFAMTANNALCYSCFKNGSWSEPVELISASSTITSSAIGTLDSKAYIAITRDIDCDLETNNDRYVSLVDFEGNIIDIATEGNNNEHVDYITENGVNKFIWLCDGNLLSITGANSPVTQVLEEPVPALSSGYQLVENNKGGFDILFTEAVGDGSEVYGMFYDEGWCSPVRVTRTESDRYLESYAATYIGDRLLIPYLSTAVTFNEDEMETTANLCCTTVEFKSDLKAESAEIDYENLMEEPEVSTFSLFRSSKTATVNLKVSNNGLSKVESVTVSIPELSFSQSQSVTIMPGETQEISAVFNLPDDITADDLTVTVSPTGSDDMDSTDNSASFKIGYTDFSVAAEQRILGNQDYILVGVTNNGNISGNAVLKVIKDNLDGETLYELAIENLGIGETRYYMIETDSGFFDENSDCGLITVYAETDTLEEIDYNNYEFVVLNHFNREIVDTENLVPNSSIGATSAVFDKYAPQNITVEIDANGNTFEGISELSTDNYTVGENVTISKSYLSTLEVGSYDFTFVFRSSETQTQERVFTVVVEDSSPVAPEISGEQISVSVYDGNAIEEDVDFAVYTNSDGAVTFSYSSDNGATWISGLPVLAGTYLIKADVAATEEYVASSAQFTVTISKAGRAIPSPAAITVTNSSVSLTTVIPTVFESEDTVYYGYSSTNDASTINNWSLNPVFDGLNANTEYYFFAKVSGGNNYEDAISVATSVKTSKNSVNAPEAPVLESKTDTSVTLVSADGYEYRCNNGEWQSKNTFEGLKPNQSYSFTQRIAETENSYASAPSAALVVTTDKSVTQAPEAPDIEGKTDTTVTLSHTNGYEYRCNDGVWTDSNIFTGLDRNTEYIFYQRVSETDISYASESSEALTVITDKTELSGTVVINGIAQTAENLTADVSAVKPAEAQFTYQWYSDGNAISGETSAEYTVTYNDLGHEISVEVTGINDFKGTLISASVIPVAASANGIVSIEGDPVYGNDLTATVTELNPSYAEYAMQWYRGDTPIGGATKEKYTVAKEDIGQQITVRITGVNGYDISVLSAGVIPVKQTVDAPQAPKAETVTSDSITLVANDGYEYRIGNGEWQSSNVFTADGNGNALMPDTEYAFSQRVKETETAFASAESEIAVITTNPIRVESISISETNIEVVKTYPYQLSASVSPENATDKNIIWLSSDESVATVDQNGFVTAIESGNTVITAKSADGGFTASCVITVVPDTYTVIWNVNGEKTTQEVRYSEYITAPQNPVADGYEFIGWTPEIPQTMPLYDLEFTAVFEPIEYYAEFVADGVTVSRVPYNVETDSINAPVVPNKIGYSGKWENYELTIGGITVNAIYTVNAYKVTWVVDGEETQMSANYGESIDKSFVPQKDGYKFMGWTPDVPQTMPARDLTFTAVFEKSYICPDCGDEVLGEDAINNHIASEARMKATVKIKNNSGSKTIKYGETLRLTAITTNMPADAKIYWYVDGVKKGEGETFNVSISNGSVEVTVKVVDANGNAIINANGIEISDAEKVSVNSSFWQKIVSFFKNLFGMNRTVVQAFKGVF